MRDLLLFLIASSVAVWSAGCAQVEACAADEVLVDGDCIPEDPSSKIIPLQCKDSLTDGTSELEWALTVRTLPIAGGEPFTASLEGVAMINETFLDDGQDAVPGGVQSVTLFDLNATVHVRSGATGDDVILTVDPDQYEYQCVLSRAACDPAKDLPSVPGRRGNPDCDEPEGHTNPCGRFILLPTSTDCAPGGECAERDKTGPESQCEKNQFCITDNLEIHLKRMESHNYTADPEGEVLFGWADESLERPMFDDPTGPIGFRVGAGPVLVLVACSMRFGLPDEGLISFPIETP